MSGIVSFDNECRKEGIILVNSRAFKPGMGKYDVSQKVERMPGLRLRT